MPVSFQISACSGRSLISQILRTLRLCSFGMTGMWGNKRGKKRRATAEWLNTFRIPFRGPPFPPPPDHTDHRVIPIPVHRERDPPIQVPSLINGFELITIYGTPPVFCRAMDMIITAKTDPLRGKVNRKSGSYRMDRPEDWTSIP